MSGKRYTSGEIATAAGVTVRTIQHYDNIGLLPSTGRTDGGRRYYTQDDLVRLEQIVFYKSLDFPLDQIKERLLLQPDKIELLTMLEEQRLLLLQRMEHLHTSLATIGIMSEMIESDKEPPSALMLRFLSALPGDDVFSRAPWRASGGFGGRRPPCEGFEREARRGHRLRRGPAHSRAGGAPAVLGADLRRAGRGEDGVRGRRPPSGERSGTAMTRSINAEWKKIWFPTRSRLYLFLAPVAAVVMGLVLASTTKVTRGEALSRLDPMSIISANVLGVDVVAVLLLLFAAVQVGREFRERTAQSYLAAGNAVMALFYVLLTVSATFCTRSTAAGAAIPFIVLFLPAIAELLPGALRDTLVPILPASAIHTLSGQAPVGSAEHTGALVALAVLAAWALLPAGFASWRFQKTDV